MHAHDRTMISRLGFADPDKQNPTHDLACQYLIRPELITQFLGRFHEQIIPPRVTESSGGYGSTSWNWRATGPPEWIETKAGSAWLERIISKGEGKYQTTIGFIDVVFEATFEFKIPGIQCRYGGTDSGIEKAKPYPVRAMFAFEVKTSPVGIGEIIRQINLYRSHFNSSSENFDQQFWILATTFPLSSSNVATLRDARIHHIRLGEAFIAWKEAREREEQQIESDGADVGSLEF